MFWVTDDRWWVLVNRFIPQFEDKQLVYSCLVYLSTVGRWGVGVMLSWEESG
jgi:hypothetical protein